MTSSSNSLWAAFGLVFVIGALLIAWSAQESTKPLPEGLPANMAEPSVPQQSAQLRQVHTGRDSSGGARPIPKLADRDHPEGGKSPSSVDGSGMTQQEKLDALETLHDNFVGILVTKDPAVLDA